MSDLSEARQAGPLAAMPGGVRVRLAPSMSPLDVPSALVEPFPEGEWPAEGERPADDDGATRRARVTRDGRQTTVALVRRGPTHALLVGQRATPVIMLPVESAPGSAGILRREVLVDGWRIEVEIESEARAALREKARRDAAGASGGGPTELRATIPGRIVSVAVAEGDEVKAGQQLLVIEAMKMQNEVSSPRDGRVARLAVGPAQTIELGDLLVALE